MLADSIVLLGLFEDTIIIFVVCKLRHDCLMILVAGYVDAIDMSMLTTAIMLRVNHVQIDKGRQRVDTPRLTIIGHIH